ncbi:MAG: isoprenylcysteine carboxylmethyltransferase family protein [Propionibacteriaceae bacterium]|nr:isoprenylcysteine carboxylmethyltransferase family protein [Propionibacteriaceae bacterium]
MQAALSLVLFACLIALVAVRAGMLRRRGIQAMVFGKTNKSDFVIPFVAAGLLYALLAGAFGWPIWNVLVDRFWSGELTGWIGIGFCVLGLVGFAATLVSFGESFRVGIDVDAPAKLVTTGAFALSRNPIYVSFLFFFFGLFLINRNLVISVAVVGFAFAIHRQILREEAFLAKQYRAEYAAYCRKVRRYL